MFSRHRIHPLSLFLVYFNVVWHVQSNCIDLTPYATNEQNLAALIDGGGQIEASQPVFFDVPGLFVSGQVTFCLENIIIPDTVDGNSCTEGNSCYLAVGKKITATSKDEQECKRTTGSNNLLPCYSCLCSDSKLDTGSTNQTIIGGCGPSSLDRWAMGCRDTTNGRYTWEGDGRVASELGTVHVTICPDPVQNRCPVCSGGFHPSFRVGLQWITSIEEQCFNNAFGTGEKSIRLGLLLGVIFGSLGGLVLVAILLRLLCRVKEKDGDKSSPPTKSANVGKSNFPKPPMVSNEDATPAGNV